MARSAALVIALAACGTESSSPDTDAGASNPTSPCDAPLYAFCDNDGKNCQCLVPCGGGRGQPSDCTSNECCVPMEDSLVMACVPKSSDRGLRLCDEDAGAHADDGGLDGASD